jgi:hypothetical protein
MRSQAWIELLRRVPPQQHDSLVLVSNSGTEISLHSLLRMEADYVIVRGRLAGTTDTGRIFFIPYDQIDYLGFQKELAEAQVRALLGEPELPPAAAVEAPHANGAAVPSAAEPSPPSETLHATEDIANGSEPPKPGDKLAIPGKEVLLERLRARASLGGMSKVTMKPTPS